MNEDEIIDVLDIVIIVNCIITDCWSVSTVTDFDGNVYNTVIIGDQEWMAENLKVTHYRNGDEIPNITNNSEWSSLSTGAYGIYNNDPTNTEVYGNLYNWYAVDDTRGVCPEGFHAPSDEEWMELEMTLGMSYEEAITEGYRGTDEGSQLAGNVDLWDSGALESNSEFGASGFLALPGGSRYDYNGYSYSMGNYCYFWSSTAISSGSAWCRFVGYNGSGVGRYSAYLRVGFSVRCIGD
ncbi:MAG: fibrobacter succinogenes major paralogous domain-containing protein [Candidatus Marinimicrobia bacterium]|nr:fibrobacter succinogenes major paralogous domain-containing protein [Candidatus Neomarinimicrobiota bacterium]